MNAYVKIKLVSKIKMTKFLEIALDQKNPNFHQGVLKLNKLAGQLNKDIQFTQFLKKNISQKISLLNLDPVDTSLQELYYSLKEKLIDDENHLAKSLRFLAAENISAEADLAKGFILKLNQSVGNLSILTAKPVFIRQILSKLQLSKTAKSLGYRSKSSMLKLEPIENIMIAFNQFETTSTLQSFKKSLKKISINDLDYKKLTFKSESGINNNSDFSLLTDYLTATLTINLSNLNARGWLIKSLTEVADQVNCWVAKNKIIESIKFRSDFTEYYNFVINDNSQTASEFLDNFLNNYSNDSAINDLLSELSNFEDKSTIFKIDNNLFHLNNLDFWTGTNFLLDVSNNQSVSFNIKDLVNDLISKKDFMNRTLSYGRMSLKREFMSQYFNFSYFIDYLINLMSIKKDSLMKEIFIG